MSSRRRSWLSLLRSLLARAMLSESVPITSLELVATSSSFAGMYVGMTMIGSDRLGWGWLGSLEELRHER